MDRAKSYQIINIKPQTTVRKGVIDLHCHIGITEDREWGTIEQFLEVAKMYHIFRFVVLCYEEWMNQYVKEAMRRFPDTFIGFGFVNLDKDGPEKIDWLKENGFSGVKTYDNQKPYDDDKYMPIYESLAGWGQPMVFHTSHHSPTVSPRALRRILKTFPEWKIIGAHLGSNFHQEAAEILQEFSNLYYDLSGDIVCRHPYEYLGKLLYWENAWERVVFGSDATFGRLANYIKVYEEAMDFLDVSEDIKRDVFAGNARKLIGLR